MATAQYASKENAGRKFWTGRYGRYAIRTDANRPGVYRWLITLEGRSVRKGIAADRAEAAAAVSDALDELPCQKSSVSKSASGDHAPGEPLHHGHRQMHGRFGLFLRHRERRIGVGVAVPIALALPD
jgi:hypothetical protein